jgi:hypothetical protein
MILPALIILATSTGDAPMFPVPTGPHVVGRSSFTVSDTTRSEPFTSDTSDHRELGIDIWYPAESGDGTRTVVDQRSSGRGQGLPTH